MKKRVFSVVLITLLCLGIVGCDSNAGNGALIGAGAGGLLGGAIGSSRGKVGGGALIGAAAGAIGGALIGGAMDANERKAREEREQQDRIYAQREYQRPAYSPNAVTYEDIITWTQRGEREEIIMDRIARSGTIYYMTPADDARLHNAGVSDRVIAMMHDTARR